MAGAYVRVLTPRYFQAVTDSTVEGSAVLMWARPLVIGSCCKSRFLLYIAAACALGDTPGCCFVFCLFVCSYFVVVVVVDVVVVVVLFGGCSCCCSLVLLLFCCCCCCCCCCCLSLCVCVCARACVRACVPFVCVSLCVWGGGGWGWGVGGEGRRYRQFHAFTSIF